MNGEWTGDKPYERFESSGNVDPMIPRGNFETWWLDQLEKNGQAGSYVKDN